MHYRIDDIYALDGPTFFALAVRVSAYPGVMSARYAKLAEEEEGTSPPGRTSSPTTTAVAGDPNGIDDDLVEWL